jgi:hypothetical protein
MVAIEGLYSLCGVKATLNTLSYTAGIRGIEK